MSVATAAATPATKRSPAPSSSSLCSFPSRPWWCSCGKGPEGRGGSGAGGGGVGSVVAARHRCARGNIASIQTPRAAGLIGARSSCHRFSCSQCTNCSARMDTVKGIWSVGMDMVQAPTELQREQDGLQTKLLSARMLISRSEWGMFKNMELDALLVKLKYATYDAEDLLREYKDRELRQKVEQTGRSRAGQLFVSSIKNNSIIFAIRTQRIRDAQDKLEKVMTDIKEELSSTGLDLVEPVQFMPTTAEIITASQVYGLDTEGDQLMEMLGVTATIDREDEINQVITQLGMPFSVRGTAAVSRGKTKTAAGRGALPSTCKSAKRPRGRGNSSSSIGLDETATFTCDVAVLPIFGIGGIGKTTLAQLIYNDQRVKAHYSVRIWVCVSDLFDIERMTKEIVKTISDPNFDLSCGLTDLQAEVKEQLKSQKFLLVLDDVSQITQHEWQSFYAYLRDGVEGSMILVTTRHENIAQLVATSKCKPVHLKGLPDDTFWEFFKKCAFGKESPESYPPLQEIGWRISSKLSGTPLAAKTLGRLLNSNLNEEHWDAIENSELWEQEQQEGDIFPALRLSYLYLPYQLRRCFAFCCMFPKDYSFERHEIVGIWVAQGFVAPQGNMCLEDIGIRYFDELRGRCLFQSDPMFPNNHNRYVMHDLIHDTVQHVSKHECLLMTDLSYFGRHEFRHVSVEVDAKSLNTMKNIQHLNRLRSLRFGKILSAEISWFSQLSNILFLSLKGCRLVKLPESICELSSLRYLDISNSKVKELPEKFWCLYSLQVVDANHSCMETIHKDVTKLIKLRQLALPNKASIALSKLPGLGNLSCLRHLRYFTVGNQEGSIAELKAMNQLRGMLSIKSLHNVNSQEAASAARLVDKKYLKELNLIWRLNPRTSRLSPHENEVADGLRPNEGIEGLKIHGFWGNRLPSWLNPENLQNLRRLELSHCFCFEILLISHFGGGTQGDSTGQRASSSTNCSNASAFLAFRHLTRISIMHCNGLKNLDQFLSPKNMPCVEVIHLLDCSNLESIPEDFVGFVHLRDLLLAGCTSLVCPQSREMVFPSSLQRLYINSCGQLDSKSFSCCLEKLTSVSVLCLVGCDNVESIPLDSIPCRNTLKLLQLERCPKLSSIGRSGVPSSIKYVKVSDCAKLTEVSQPYRKNALSTEDVNEIRKFVHTL